jgi:Carboxypeptidase regulatory-like domain
MFAAFGVCFFVSLTGAVFGQTVSGEITGTITQQGRLVPGVTVLVHNAVFNHDPVKTDESGTYVVWLQPGTYEVLVDRSGIGDQRQSIRVEPAKSVRLDFQLEPSYPIRRGPMFRQNWPLLELTDFYIFMVPILIISGLCCLILYSVSRQPSLMAVATVVVGSSLFTALLFGLYRWFLSSHPK